MVKVLQQNTWIDDKKLLKSCVQARAEQDNMNYPAYGMWTADFVLRKNESRTFLGKYLNEPHIPWRHKMREMMAIAGMHSGSQMACKNGRTPLKEISNECFPTTRSISPAPRALRRTAEIGHMCIRS